MSNMIVGRLLVWMWLPVTLAMLSGCGPSLPSNEIVGNNVRDKLSPEFISAFEVGRISSTVVAIDKLNVSAQFQFTTKTKESMYKSVPFGSSEWTEEFRKSGGDFQAFNEAVKVFGALPAESKVGVFIPELPKKDILRETVAKGTETSWVGKMKAENLNGDWRFGSLESFAVTGVEPKGQVRGRYPSSVVAGAESEAYFSELKSVTSSFTNLIDEKRKEQEAKIVARKKEIQEQQEKYIATYKAAVSSGKSYTGIYERYDNPVSVQIVIDSFSPESGLIKGKISTTDPATPFSTEISGILNFGQNLDDKFPIKITLAASGIRPDSEKRTTRPMFTPFYRGDKWALQLADGKLLGKGSETKSVVLAP